MLQSQIFFFLFPHSDFHYFIFAPFVPSVCRNSPITLCTSFEGLHSGSRAARPGLDGLPSTSEFCLELAPASHVDTIISFLASSLLTKGLFTDGIDIIECITTFSRRGLSSQWFLLISKEAGSQDIHAVESKPRGDGAGGLSSFFFSQELHVKHKHKEIEYEEENLGKTSE